MTARRTFLALGSAAIAVPFPPTLAAPSRVGKVELLWRQVPALAASYEAAQAAMHPGLSKAEWRRLFEMSNAASSAIGKIELQVLATPAETVADALLILAIGSDYAVGAADCNMDDDATAECFRGYARATRRAADFLAAQLGRDLPAMMGPFYDPRGSA